MLLKKLYLLFFSPVFFIILESINIFMKCLDIKYYQFFIFLFFIFCLFISLKKNYIIMLLFLISLFTFVYGRIILLPILFNEEITISWFHYYKISNETLYFVCKLLFYNLFGIYLGMIFFNKKKYKKIKMEHFYSSKIFFIILNICFIFFLIRNYIFLKNFYMYGNYLDIFLGNLRQYATYSNYIRVLSAIFQPLLIIFIAFYINKENKKMKLFLFFLYGISSFMFSLIGRRIFFINSIFVILFLSIKKIKFKHVFISILIFLQLIFFSQIMSSYRNEKEVNNINLETMVKDFIKGQGITGTFLALLKDKPELFERKMPYIFSSFMGKTLESQSDDSVDVKLPGRINLAVQLSARSNYSMYKQGFGMGGNYIIEMYDLGKEYSVIILSFLFTYFSLYFFQNIHDFSFFFRSILIFILNGYFSIPRSSYFPNIFSINFLYILIIFLGIIFLEKILPILGGKQKKNEKNINSYW